MSAYSQLEETASRVYQKNIGVKIAWLLGSKIQNVYMWKKLFSHRLVGSERYLCQKLGIFGYQFILRVIKRKHTVGIGPFMECKVVLTGR